MQVDLSARSEQPSEDYEPPNHLPTERVPSRFDGGVATATGGGGGKRFRKRGVVRPAVIVQTCAESAAGSDSAHTWRSTGDLLEIQSRGTPLLNTPLSLPCRREGRAAAVPLIGLIGEPLAHLPN